MVYVCVYRYPNASGVQPWYLLQTNYDHWTSPPFFDNRSLSLSLLVSLFLTL